MRLRKHATNKPAASLLAISLMATANALAMHAEKVALTVELLPENAPKRAIIPEGPCHVPPTWKTELDFNDADWIASGNGPGGVGYEAREDYLPLISLDVTWQMQYRNESCYIRIPFNLDVVLADVRDLALRVRYDDGFVAYINGVEVARSNFEGAPQWNSSATGYNGPDDMGDNTFYISKHTGLLRREGNLLAIQGLNVRLRSTDFLILPELSATCLVPGRIIHVDADASGSSDGSNWANAYNYLQDAVSDANTAPKPVEIRIAEGLYRPDTSASEPNGTHDRSATFRLIDGVTLIGGYAGVGHPDPNARDIGLCETILSGDLLGNDAEVNSPPELAGNPSRTDNSLHVVTSIGNNTTAILDGLTITAGNADAGYGAGIYIDKAVPTVRYCTFTDNVAEMGGAFYAYWTAYPDETLSNCTFVANLATDSGGAVYTQGYFDIAKCTFLDNHALNEGGAATTELCMLKDCYFQGNSAGLGGAVYASTGTVITDSSFVSNVASSGGAICYSGYFSDIIVRNSLFFANHTRTEGGGILSNGRFTADNCTFVENRPRSGATFNLSRPLFLTNSILRDQALGQAGSFNIEYSNIEGGWPGSGNIDADPCFVDPGYWAHIADPNIRVEPNDPNAVLIIGDYHLKSEAGRWDSAAGTWVQDQVTSPCIDTGDPNADYAGEPWPHGARVNMGAYGATKEASLSPSDAGAPGDLDYDGFAYRPDILSFAGQWLLSDALAYADFTRDGVVTFPDFALFAGSYQRPPMPEPASNPAPADAVADVNNVAPVLTWTSDANSLWHDVYFGNEDPPPFRTRQKLTTFETGTLDPNTWHYWRIDEMNPAGITTGPIWSFKTEGLPLRATNPTPAHPAFGVPTNQILSWTPG
ncbi:MAG: hypothetical protein ACYS8Z_23180, partial [Planctomycetota bacterium]